MRGEWIGWRLAAVIVVAIVVTASLMMWQAALERPHDDVVLHGGTSVQAPVDEIVAAFQRRTGIRVYRYHGPSDQLLEHLTTAREAAGLFLPGDPFYLDRAQEVGLVEQTEVVAWLVPAILVPQGNPQGIESLADFARPHLRLAMADPRFPAEGCRTRALGRIMPSLLERHGLTVDDIEPNVVVTAASGHELGNAVVLGHVDGAVLWEPVARSYSPAEVVTIPAETNLALPLKAGLLGHARENSAARAFLEFLGSATAREILQTHHYTLAWDAD